MHPPPVRSAGATTIEVPMSTDLPTPTTTRDTTSASIVVDATPAEIFAFLRDPDNHPIISGDQSVQRSRGGSRQLSLGDRFGMDMKIGMPYAVASTVKEFEQDRRIAWAHFGGHRWRWELEPTDDGRTKVTETFDLSTAVFPYKQGLRVVGYPRRHERNVARSVVNLAAHFAD
jgi:carbon monoxide dehydrogenase subunit G